MGRPKMLGEVPKKIPVKIKKSMCDGRKNKKKKSDEEQMMVDEKTFNPKEMNGETDSNMLQKIQSMLTILENTARYMNEHESDLQISSVIETMDNKGNYKITRTWDKKAMSAISDAIDVTDAEIEGILEANEVIEND